MRIVKTKRFHLQRIIVSVTSANDTIRGGGIVVAAVGGAGGCGCGCGGGASTTGTIGRGVGCGASSR